MNGPGLGAVLASALLLLGMAFAASTIVSQPTLSRIVFVESAIFQWEDTGH